MSAARASHKSIDRYIAKASPEVRAVLRKLRSTIKRAAPPETEELISYRMPAFALHGILVYFAAFKNHIGIFPPLKGDAKLQAAASKYAGPKGNLKFPLDKPIPYALVARIVKSRVRQNRAKAAKTGGARKRSKPSAPSRSALRPRGQQLV
jgi:uncharacterized protein YdhG (YjbR/CyaY superfamily)